MHRPYGWGTTTMPRQKLPPELKVAKEGFSGPRKLIDLIKEKTDAKTNRGAFSKWICEAIEEKLENDHPALYKEWIAARDGAREPVVSSKPAPDAVVRQVERGGKATRGDDTTAPKKRGVGEVSATRARE
jgi:hypothetical protein